MAFQCPQCRRAARSEIAAGSRVLCAECDWSRPISDLAIREGQPYQCVVCGCDDLWRQKDFPKGLGLFLVALGAALSTLAWANYMPKTALGVLLAFALADLLAYTWMNDVLVCYRCRARYRHTSLDADHPQFNLETAERYRQEAARLEEKRVNSREG